MSGYTKPEKGAMMNPGRYDISETYFGKLSITIIKTRRKNTKRVRTNYNSKQENAVCSVTGVKELMKTTNSLPAQEAMPKI